MEDAELKAGEQRRRRAGQDLTAGTDGCSCVCLFITWQAAQRHVKVERFAAV